jgi:ABC-2 type transport system ATP-binding protein
MFIGAGRIALSCTMEEFDSRYRELTVNPGHLNAAREIGPVHERQVFGREILLFDGVDPARLAAHGEVRTPGISDLFLAVMDQSAGEARGAAK